MNFGRLVLCSLPIGNKDDISLNVLNVLATAQYICAEDTRTIKKLITEYGHSLDGKNIFSFHDQSNPNDLSRILSFLKSGIDIYYFSEAGSPSISDPAFPLVRAASDLGASVFTFPGACSVISALELSGLPSIPFTFGGFLPREKGKIYELLNSLPSAAGTHVYFESPRRVLNIINLLEKALEENIFPTEICFVREITKVNQQVIRLNKNNFLDSKDQLVSLGEFVIVLYYARAENHYVDMKELRKTCLEVIENGVSQKRVSKLISKITGESSKSIYQKLNSK